jgi:hypothetical protein
VRLASRNNAKCGDVDKGDILSTSPECRQEFLRWSRSRSIGPERGWTRWSKFELFFSSCCCQRRGGCHARAVNDVLASRAFTWGA